MVYHIVYDILLSIRPSQITIIYLLHSKKGNHCCSTNSSQLTSHITYTDYVVWVCWYKTISAIHIQSLYTASLLNRQFLVKFLSYCKYCSISSQEEHVCLANLLSDVLWSQKQHSKSSNVALKIFEQKYQEIYSSLWFPHTNTSFSVMGTQ